LACLQCKDWHEAARHLSAVHAGRGGWRVGMGARVLTVAPRLGAALFRIRHFFNSPSSTSRTTTATPVRVSTANAVTSRLGADL
jgi:hypothetical protein